MSPFDLRSIFLARLGGEVFGIPGMFLSIPAIAALRIIWQHRVEAS